MLLKTLEEYFTQGFLNSDIRLCSAGLLIALFFLLAVRLTLTAIHVGTAHPAAAPLIRDFGSRATYTLIFGGNTRYDFVCNSFSIICTSCSQGKVVCENSNTTEVATQIETNTFYTKLAWYPAGP